MGKHSGENGDKPGAPFGQGPHPTLDESKRKGQEFDQQYNENRRRGLKDPKK